MNTKILGIAILLVVSLVFSGCIQSKAPAVDTTTTTLAPTSASVVSDLTETSTGTGTNDITSSDLEAIQNDLDEIDVGVDELSESDI
jgi:hypothetical protein